MGGGQVSGVARHIASLNTIKVSEQVLLVVVAGLVARLRQVERRPSAVSTLLCCCAVVVLAAPHLSRVVEDYPSAVAISVLMNAGVPASPFVATIVFKGFTNIFTAIPGKCVTKEEKQYT